MRPKFKISNLTQLQDARYCAAVGFDFVSFSLERGSFQKLPVSGVWNMVQWLDGPSVILEINTASVAELDELSFGFRYLTFPYEEWSLRLFRLTDAIILRGDEYCAPQRMMELVDWATEEDKELKFELSLPAPEALLPYRHVLRHLFVNFPSLQMTRDFMLRGQGMPYGFSFRAEALDGTNGLDYEQLDEVMAMFSDVHL